MTSIAHPCVLDVVGLSVTYASPDGAVKAVDDFSLCVARAETVCIVGESGSGKSTAMLATLDLLPEGARAEAKTLAIGRTDLRRAGKAQLRRVRGSDVGFVFQDPMSSLNPVLTVQRQITEGMRLHKRLSHRKARERALELLRLVGISDPERRMHAYPHELSGGMRQRIMIAIALACEPALLIGDEPTTALDVTIQAQILALIDEIKRRSGCSIVWITHDLGVVAHLADRVMVMYAGRVVEEAPVIELFRAAQHPYTIALLRSLPDTKETTGRRLEPIPGAPAQSVAEHSCAFAPRCRFAIPRCRTERPPLEIVGEQHTAACWVKPIGADLS